jgi:protein disulfide-isomerase A6
MRQSATSATIDSWHDTASYKPVSLFDRVSLPELCSLAHCLLLLRPIVGTTMLPITLLGVALLLPSLASAAIFPKDTTVKLLNPKTWKKHSKSNQPAMVAFVAPWCGHCQRMAPEYSKASASANPMIPFYAIDCDEDANKPLCSEHGVRGFPTVKFFPKGLSAKSTTFEYERSASALFNFAKNSVPKTVKKLLKAGDVKPWIEETKDQAQARIVLLTKETKVPLLWNVLSSMFKDKLTLATNSDKNGKTSQLLGLDTEGKSKILVYSPGSTKPYRYEGTMKLDALNKFFKSILDGTADIAVPEDETTTAEIVGETATSESEPEKVVEAETSQDAPSVTPEPAEAEAHPTDEL